MANPSLNDSLSNQKALSTPEVPLFDLRDKVDEALRQAVALASIANGQDFLDFNESILHDYLWALRNSVISAAEQFAAIEARLDTLGVFKH